ncbi:MAG: membrane lipoprotein lipid attachment site-containing protein [Bacillota bacterium]|nr:membrane lipoprotein lipid attachment site-containing protein [Bacillota bacterium]
MKRFFVFLILLLTLSGCQNTQNQDTVSKKLYNQYRQYYQLVTSSHDFQAECEECSIQLIVNKTTNKQIRYDVIINNPKIEMDNIKAIAYVDKKNKDIPSIGLLEENSFSLKPDYINKEEGFYKGINLSGLTTQTKFKVRIYFTYENNGIKKERYVILNGNAS